MWIHMQHQIRKWPSPSLRTKSKAACGHRPTKGNKPWHEIWWYPKFPQRPNQNDHIALANACRAWAGKVGKTPDHSWNKYLRSPGIIQKWNIVKLKWWRYITHITSKMMEPCAGLSHSICSPRCISLSMTCSHWANLQDSSKQAIISNHVDHVAWWEDLGAPNVSPSWTRSSSVLFNLNLPIFAEHNDYVSSPGLEDSINDFCWKFRVHATNLPIKNHTSTASYFVTWQLRQSNLLKHGRDHGVKKLWPVNMAFSLGGSQEIWGSSRAWFECIGTPNIGSPCFLSARMMKQRYRKGLRPEQSPADLKKHPKWNHLDAIRKYQKSSAANGTPEESSVWHRTDAAMSSLGLPIM